MGLISWIRLKSAARQCRASSVASSAGKSGTIAPAAPAALGRGDVVRGPLAMHDRVADHRHHRRGQAGGVNAVEHLQNFGQLDSFAPAPACTRPGSQRRRRSDRCRECPTRTVWSPRRDQLFEQPGGRKLQIGIAGRDERHHLLAPWGLAVEGETLFNGRVWLSFFFFLYVGTRLAPCPDSFESRATSAASLSPRPERQITMISLRRAAAANFRACATACELSSAGRIPSFGPG